jgi:hypothetical protein
MKIMKKTILLFLISCQLFSLKAQEQENFIVNVHPGVELFTIVQLLAEKFPNPNPSSYSKEIMDYFGKYKNHPAVLKVKGFGNVYPDLTELGWTMSNFPAITVYEPTAELNWYKHYGKENVLEYIKLCRDFFNDIKKQILNAGAIAQLQNFYGFNADVKWYICIDPLNSWGSHAIATKNINPQFSNIIAYNTGNFNTKSTQDEPFFDYKGTEYLVWHEGSHIFLDSYFKKYKKEIEELSYLFNKDDEGMKRNGIGSWEYCLNENMVRSIVGYLYKTYKTEREFKRQVARETASDFIYVEDITPFIVEKYGSNKRYKTFDAFFPEMLKMLKKKYPKAS